MAKIRHKKELNTDITPSESFVETDAEVSANEVSIVNAGVNPLADKRIRALSVEDKSICTNIATKGVDFLRFELGWSAMRVKGFMIRVGVQAELDYLRRAYEQREGIQERTQFFAQISLNKMVPRALQTIAQTLRGDSMNDDGEIERGPSRSQFDAAVEVLERSNIQGGKFKGTDGIFPIDARSINVSLGLQETKEDAIGVDSAKKVRNFMDRFMSEAAKVKNDRKKRKKKRSRYTK